MTPEIALTLAIIAVSLVLFSFERIPADVIALGVLLTIVVTGLLPPDQAFSGFGSDTFMMILGLLVLTAALVRTGVVDLVGRSILRRTGDHPQRLMTMTMIAPGFLSSFMSNTAATAFFLPMILGLSRKAKVNAGKLLMPLAFSSILASSVTLVATSTNIVVSGLMTRAGMPPLGMFELTPVGLPILLTGIAYMLTIGQRMIPNRYKVEDSIEEFGAKTFVAEAVLLPGSPLAGLTLAQSGLGRDLDLAILRVRRDGKEHSSPQADFQLEHDDELLVEGPRDQILRINQAAGIGIKADLKLSDPSILAEDMRLVEVILLQRSPLINRTLKGIQFRERYGVQVLAVNRRGETLLPKISQLRFQLGDVLLIQGHRNNIAALEADNIFQVIQAIDGKQANTRRAPIAVGAFLGALALATFNITSFAVAVLLGAMVVFITRCITPEEAYRQVEWRALILIGSMLAVGNALEVTGAAKFLAMQIANATSGLSPIFLLGGFFVLTMLLTQPMSNQAAAVVVVPIAIQTALQLGLNPRAFAVMIAVGASCSYLTPLEPACLMVYGPGRYKFFDFVKVGSILTILIFLIAILLVPLLWPLQ